MTKAELLKALEPYPDDVRIVVHGYEGGFDDPVIEPALVRLDQPERWCGAHGSTYEYNVAEATACVGVRSNHDEDQDDVWTTWREQNQDAPEWARRKEAP